MTERFKDDALREVYALEQKLASQRKTLANTLKTKTADICEAVIKSLESRIAATEQEAITLPERPNRFSLAGAGYTPILHTRPRDVQADPFTEEELAGLDIPTFLRRTA